MYQAKTQLSKLVADAVNGYDIAIGKNGIPLVKLTAIKEKKSSRKAGQLKGKIWMSKDFEELPEWFLSYFGPKPKKKNRT